MASNIDRRGMYLHHHASNRLVRRINHTGALCSVINYLWYFVTLNGNTVALNADTNLAEVVDAFNTAQIGDIRAAANSDGTLTLSSESGVNIVLKDVGSGTATNAMFATATDIHGESISVSTVSSS